MDGIKQLSDYNNSNYPGFYWVDNYKDDFTILANTECADDWYIPAKNELETLKKQKTTVYNSMKAINSNAEEIFTKANSKNTSVLYYTVTNYSEGQAQDCVYRYASVYRNHTADELSWSYGPRDGWCIIYAIRKFN